MRAYEGTKGHVHFSRPSSYSTRKRREQYSIQFIRKLIHTLFIDATRQAPKARPGEGGSTFDFSTLFAELDSDLSSDEDSEQSGDGSDDSDADDDVAQVDEDGVDEPVTKHAEGQLDGDGRTNTPR